MISTCVLCGKHPVQAAAHSGYFCTFCEGEWTKSPEFKRAQHYASQDNIGASKRALADFVNDWHKIRQVEGLVKTPPPPALAVIDGKANGSHGPTLPAPALAKAGTR